jgi:hypothetical protein
METWKPLNMELRSWAISHLLRLEQTSSSAIRAILRMFNDHSKTLGNQSSALSFKSKIDLLYDLEEIDKTEYNHLLKLMEIRNQFAHNPNATSFEEFDNINPDINKYLEKFPPKNTENIKCREDFLKSSFNDLFQVTAGKLISIDIEYTQGMHKELRRYINDRIVENVDSIWKTALEKNNAQKANLIPAFIMMGGHNEAESLYLQFRIAMSDFAQEQVKEIEGENLKTAFKQKETLEEALARIEKCKKAPE